MTKVLAASRARLVEQDDLSPKSITFRSVFMGSPTPALQDLKMVVKHDALRPTARVLIEPWLVEAALARLGDRRFTREEQASIVKATRTPKNVKWPDWWEVKP